MALQDLTPQLRTRLGRGERLVGLFIGVALLILVGGFGYYLYHTAVRKGWFLEKVPYYIYVHNAASLKPGDPVRMMGFDVGEITEVNPTPPDDWWFVQNGYNVFVRFIIKQPNYGYVWTDSEVKVSSGDLLGKRVLEVTRGQTGKATVIVKEGELWIADEHVSDQYNPLTPASKGYWLTAQESAAVTEQVDQIVKMVETALPGLTNQLAVVLGGSSEVTSNLNLLLRSAQPLTVNLNEISERLRDFDGSLGRWLFPSNFNDQLAATLTTADSALNAANLALTDASTNLAFLSEKLAVSLDHMAGITSNLNHQVEVNTNILGRISDAVVHADELVEGLKRHWFLRSAFKKPKPTNTPPARPTTPSRGVW